MADAFVASEKVGEGGPWPKLGFLFTLEEMERVRSERGLGMAQGGLGCVLRILTEFALVVGELSTL